jgi:hypothetical protein
MSLPKSSRNLLKTDRKIHHLILNPFKTPEYRQERYSLPPSTKTPHYPSHALRRTSDIVSQSRFFLLFLW